MSHEVDDLYNEIQDLHERVQSLELGWSKAAALVESVDRAAKEGANVMITYTRVGDHEKLEAQIEPRKKSEQY